MTDRPLEDLETETVITIPKKVWDASQQRDRTQRRLIAAAISVLLLVVALVAYGQLVSDPRQDRDRDRAREELVDKVGDIKVVVDAVRSYTDPDAQKARDQALASALVIVDCKNRDALQQLADALAERGSAARITLACSPP